MWICCYTKIYNCKEDGREMKMIGKGKVLDLES